MTTTQTLAFIFLIGVITGRTIHQDMGTEINEKLSKLFKRAHRRYTE